MMKRFASAIRKSRNVILAISLVTVALLLTGFSAVGGVRLKLDMLRREGAETSRLKIR